MSSILVDQDLVFFVVGATLHVYSLANLNKPLQQVELLDNSGITTLALSSTHLYVTVYRTVHVFRVDLLQAREQPVQGMIAEVTSERRVNKAVCIGDRLLVLGEDHGFLQIVDLNTH